MAKGEKHSKYTEKFYEDLGYRTFGLKPTAAAIIAKKTGNTLTHQGLSSLLASKREPWREKAFNRGTFLAFEDLGRESGGDWKTAEKIMRQRSQTFEITDQFLARFRTRLNKNKVFKRAFNRGSGKRTTLKARPKPRKPKVFKYDAKNFHMLGRSTKTLKEEGMPSGKLGREETQIAGNISKSARILTGLRTIKTGEYPYNALIKLLERHPDLQYAYEAGIRRDGWKKTKNEVDRIREQISRRRRK